MIQQFCLWVCTQMKWKQTQTLPCTPMFTAAWFTIAQRWRQPSVHGETNGWAGCGPPIQGSKYSASKGKETLTPATTWVNAEATMLSVRGQLQDDRLHDSMRVQDLEQPNPERPGRMTGARGWGRSSLPRPRFSLGRWRSSGDGGGWWLNDSVKVLHARKLYTWIRYVCFTTI